MNWKHACSSDRRLFDLIQVIMGENKKLSSFLFHPENASLSNGPKELFRMMKGFSSGEKVLLRVGMDLWNGSGGAQVGDVMSRLDGGSFRRVIEGMVRAYTQEGQR